MPETSSLHQLLYACALGDQKAFADLYDRTAGRMMAVAFAILRDRATAEEAVQEGFVQIWYAARTYRPDLGHPNAWLATIVRNRALDMYRSEKRAPSAERNRSAMPELPDDRRHPSDSAELTALWDCMKPLEKAQRQSILLSYYYGYSHGEVAHRMRLPVGTVKSWIRRGVAKVRECLEL